MSEVACAASAASLSSMALSAAFSTVHPREELIELTVIDSRERGQRIERGEQLVGFGLGYVEHQDRHERVGSGFGPQVAVDEL